VPPLKGLGDSTGRLPSAEALGYLLPSRKAGLDCRGFEVYWCARPAQPTLSPSAGDKGGAPISICDWGRKGEPAGRFLCALRRRPTQAKAACVGHPGRIAATVLRLGYAPPFSFTTDANGS